MNKTWYLFCCNYKRTCYRTKYFIYFICSSVTCASRGWREGWGQDPHPVSRYAHDGIIKLIQHCLILYVYNSQIVPVIACAGPSLWLKQVQGVLFRVQTWVITVKWQHLVFLAVETRGTKSAIKATNVPYSNITSFFFTDFDMLRTFLQKLITIFFYVILNNKKWYDNIHNITFTVYFDSYV